MDKITGFVYIDTKEKRALLQKRKDNGEVVPINLFLEKDGSVLYFEPIEEEEEENENKEKQVVEKIDEDGNTYFDLI